MPLLGSTFGITDKVGIRLVDADARYVNIDGDTMTGSLTATAFIGDGSGLTSLDGAALDVGSVAEDKLSFDVATQAELDTHKSSDDHAATYVNVSGDTMDGVLNLPAAGLTLGTDVNLIRSTTNVMSTSDSLVVSGSIGTGGSFSVGEQLTVLPAAVGTIGVIIKANLDQTADLLRVQDNIPNILFVVDADGLVGIGTASPDTMLHLSHATGNAVIRLERNDTTIIADDIYGALQWEGQDLSPSSTSESAGVRAKIAAISEGIQGEAAITFATMGTAGSGIGLDNTIERVRIDFRGNVGIGVTPNANALLDVSSTTKAFMPPRMTTTQRDDIASPTAGMVVYNNSTNVLNFYNGTAWGAV